ncbi:MAG: RcnB family protein [Parasphingorhabdus sp.]|uniref:RcnB family protein n=1 Tax=Parasphingorhabdus sp. TaxID=2709688 RepID=UPI003002D52D
MMKKFLMILAASTMVASPMITAQAQAATHKTVSKTVTNKHGKRVVTKTTTVDRNVRGKSANNHYSNTRYTVDQKRWSKGQHFDRRHAINYRVISNPRAYRLSNAPRGYRWVQSGNDAILIGVTSGIIGAVIGNAISR